MKWLKNLFNSSISSKKGYNDMYQIRKITLIDGTIKYYTEYRDSVLERWHQLYVFDNDWVQPTILSSYELVNTAEYAQESEEKALNVIARHKDQVYRARAKEFSSEEIIKVD